MSTRNLTEKQKQVLKFILIYISKNSYPPSFHEIRKELQISSVSTAHKHVQALRKKGLLKNLKRHSRSIELFTQGAEVVEIPLMGFVSAGDGIAPMENPEPVRVQSELVQGNGQYYALKIQGDSMIEEGIKDGDIAIIRHQTVARDGDIVIAILDEGSEKATIKRFYNLGDRVQLCAENENLDGWPKEFQFGEIEIRGKFCGLIRTED